MLEGIWILLFKFVGTIGAEIVARCVHVLAVPAEWVIAGRTVMWFLRVLSAPRLYNVSLTIGA